MDLGGGTNQPAAQQGLELVIECSAEQVHFAKAIAATEKTDELPSPTLPLGQSATALALAPADWAPLLCLQRWLCDRRKHLLQSGNRFQVTTENGTFPAQLVHVPGDMDQYLLLKIQGIMTSLPCPYTPATAHG